MSHSDEDNNFDLVEEAYEYKINSNYPEGCTAYQKRSIRRKVSKMILRGGEIFLARKERGKVLDIRLITEDGDRQRILNACHSDPTSGHLGVKKTIKRIHERFTWKGLNKDVANLVSTCDVCQCRNDKMVIKCDELHPVPVHSTWHHVAHIICTELNTADIDSIQYKCPECTQGVSDFV